MSLVLDLKEKKNLLKLLKKIEKLNYKLIFLYNSIN